MILEHSCREPEVVVKCCVRNFSNFVYCKVISRCRHRGFGLRSSTPSTSTSTSTAADECLCPPDIVDCLIDCLIFTYLPNLHVCLHALVKVNKSELLIFTGECSIRVGPVWCRCGRCVVYTDRTSACRKCSDTSCWHFGTGVEVSSGHFGTIVYLRSWIA